MAGLTYQALPQVKGSYLKHQALLRATEGYMIKHRGSEAAGEALKVALGWLRDWGTQLRIEDELKRLEPEIKRRMPEGGGVLICIGLMEWETPDATGDRAQLFMDIFIAGTGMEPGAVVNQYDKMAKLVQGPPEGWRRREKYIWVTSEQQKEINVLP